MLSKCLQAVILAAGKSTRFGTGTSKLLAPICGKKMIMYPVQLLYNLGIHLTMVVGFEKEPIQECIRASLGDDVCFVEQEEQKGTGHALLCTKDMWHTDHIVIINGDMPLISKEIITKLYAKHTETDAVISFVTARHPEASRYGRVIQQGTHVQIVEAADITEQTPKSDLINAGVYIISRAFLLKHAPSLTNNNAKHEFYITDLIGIASDARETVSTIVVPLDNVRGVNTIQELYAAERIKHDELVQYWMNRGVRFMMPDTVYLDHDVTIGAGSIIGAGVHLLRGSIVGKQCTIDAYSIIEQSTICDNAHILAHSIIDTSTVASQAEVGPYARITNTTIEHNACLGNFVEAKNSTIGAYSKAKHLTYLGNATIGQRVNIGAGTITCNYDGKDKHETIIQDNTFIGSNNTLIAPITINHHAYTAAGSTLTHDVPENALAFGRARQVIKAGYAEKIRANASPKHDIESSTEESSQDTADQKNQPEFTYSCAVASTHDPLTE